MDRIITTAADEIAEKLLNKLGFKKYQDKYLGESFRLDKPPDLIANPGQYNKVDEQLKDSVMKKLEEAKVLFERLKDELSMTNIDCDVTFALEDIDEIIESVKFPEIKYKVT